MTWINVAVAAVAVVGGVAKKKAADKEKKAARTQKRQAQLQAFQNSMESLREFQRAQAISSTAFQGSGASLESSGAQGARSSLGATEAGNQEMLSRNLAMSNQYYKYLQDAAKWKSTAAYASAAGSIISAYGSVAGAGEFKDLPEYGTVPDGGIPLQGPQVPPGGLNG